MEGPAADVQLRLQAGKRAVRDMPWKLYDTTVSRSLCETLSSFAFGSRLRSSAVIAAGSADCPLAGSEMTIVPSDVRAGEPRVQRLPEQRRERDDEDDADEGQFERGHRNRHGDDEHDEADLLRLLDGRPEANDRQRAEQAERERQRKLDRDEDRRNRNAEQRKGAMHLAAGRPVRIEVHVKIRDEHRRQQRHRHQHQEGERGDSEGPCPA